MTLTQAWQALSWQSALILLCIVVVLAIWIAILVQPRKRGATRRESYHDWRNPNGGQWLK